MTKPSGPVDETSRFKASAVNGGICSSPSRADTKAAPVPYDTVVHGQGSKTLCARVRMVLKDALYIDDYLQMLAYASS